jgi:uncharacterized protein YbjT (DUF2867 family)
MITVMGATGHTGRKIVERLLAQGETVRALGRSEHKLAELATMGAEVRPGDTMDAAFLAEAFRGADAVYTLLPTDRTSPDYAERQRTEGKAIAASIRASGVRYVVALSSVGADLAAGTGLLQGLHEQEERLRAIDGLNVLFLRPVSFFENFNDQMPLIEHEGIVADSVAADLEVPMVATRDIAEAAAAALALRDWEGVAVRELIGQRDLSHNEAVRILGERLGRPQLRYVQLPYRAMAESLVQAGLSASFANLYIEMTRAFNERRVKPAARTAANTPTSFEEFASSFRPLADPPRLRP